ncbi:MAG: hypothetical protein V1824_03405 [archaeon]
MYGLIAWKDVNKKTTKLDENIPPSVIKKATTKKTVKKKVKKMIN